jgi:hypothetical protein
MNLTRGRSWPPRGQERGSLLPTESRSAGRGQVLQDVPLLLVQVLPEARRTLLLRSLKILHQKEQLVRREAGSISLP